MERQDNIVTLTLIGEQPGLLLHNGELANPLNPIVKEMKKISGKRSKTEADYEELARLEFQGGLYMGQDGPVIPATCIEAMLINGAKKSKEGPKAKVGIFVTKNARLEYDGPSGS